MTDDNPRDEHDSDNDSRELGDGAGLWKWLEVRDCE
jgi:hypothetical protein